MMHLSRRFFRIVRRYSTHRLQLGFLIFFIEIIRLIYFTNVNAIHLRSSEHGIVDLNFCSKLAANESDFCPFLKRRGISEK